MEKPHIASFERFASRRLQLSPGALLQMLTILLLTGLLACDDDGPEDPLAYNGDIITAVINGDQDFEASGSINYQELVFHILQNRILVMTGIDRETINPLTIRIDNFDGVGTYELDFGGRTASYVVIDDDGTQNVFASNTGTIVVDSFADSIAIGTFEFDVAGGLGTLSFTEGRFALAIE